MASKRDLAKFVRPLLERDDQLHWSGRRLVIGPFAHVCGIATFETSFCGIHTFKLLAGAVLPCLWTEHDDPPRSEPYCAGSIGYGKNIYDESFRDQFLFGLFSDLIAALRSISNFQMYRCFIESRYSESGLLKHKNLPLDPYVNLCLGEFDLFIAKWPDELKYLLRYPEIERTKPHWREYLLGIGDAVTRGDIRGLADLMHDWERQRVQELGALHLWRSTPFPFEDPGAPDWRTIDQGHALSAFHTFLENFQNRPGADRAAREV